jgi:hypothetical protein
MAWKYYLYLFLVCFLLPCLLCKWWWLNEPIKQYYNSYDMLKQVADLHYDIRKKSILCIEDKGGWRVN